MTEIARINPSQIIRLHAVSLTADGDGAVLITSPQQWSYGAEVVFEIPVSPATPEGSVSEWI